MSKPQHSHKEQRVSQKPAESQNQKPAESPKAQPPASKLPIVDATPAEEAARKQAEADAKALEEKKQTAAAAKAEAARKRAESMIAIPQTREGEREATAMREGSIKLEVYRLFDLPIEQALTAEEMVEKLAVKFPHKTKEALHTSVRGRVSSFKRRYGVEIGRDEKGRINTHIKGLARPPLSPEKQAEKAKKEAERAAAKALAAEAKAKAKAESKAAADAAALAAASQAKQVEGGPKAQVVGQLKK